ncbi:MAG: hypothetical protein NT154_03955 [Verrucomicrobia bacterium]|nr:hypothetical protein [Verrucomicrobiota bacterium]
MSEFKLTCPNCQQHLQCDERFSGREIRIPKTLAASLESVLRAPAAGVAEILGRDFWWENSFYPV